MARQITMSRKSSALPFFSENTQGVVQQILYLLPDATLHVKEVEIIASKISDIVELADMSVTLAETALSVLDYILLQEIKDENFRKITNR